MFTTRTILEDNNPDTLFNICATRCVKDRHILSEWDPVGRQFKGLRPGITLPAEICEKLLQVYVEEGDTQDPSFFTIFSNPTTTRLKRVALRSCVLEDLSFEILARHQLVELEFTDVNGFPNSRNILNHYSSNLLSLAVDGSSLFLPPTPVKEEFVHGEWQTVGLLPSCCINAPKLKRLIARDIYIEKDYLPWLLNPLRQLVHLDLSEMSEVGTLSCLINLPCLTTLILYNVPQLQVTIDNICQLRLLKHLDISQSMEIRGRNNEKNGLYKKPNAILSKLVESLPYLTWLDISGTNLAGTGVAERPSASESKESLADFQQELTDIPGLRSRVRNPLEFLGLCNTQHEACQRHHIPALRISGDASEEQILTAGLAYIHRSETMQKVLNDIFHIFRYESCANSLRALDIIIQAMERHIKDSHIQISGSASLFYIVKGEQRHKLNIKVKQKVVNTLLKAMLAHSDDATMMRNGCLTLCQFRIPQDVLFSYERLVKILLRVVGDAVADDFVRRIAIYLMNSLACQVDGHFKQVVGDLGAIETMLELIEVRLSREVCDDVMEVAWSTMWNVTDETAINCKRFLDRDGMRIFLQCLKTFPDKPELLRNMMGLLGNVAEVPELRPQLMTSEFVTVFSRLLSSNSDGIEVSYNAAGVLSHMASDGEQAWSIREPQRQQVLHNIRTAIERWDLDAKRNINYRSFEPILRLLKVDHTPECQLWAVWALANLTQVYPEKYCFLMVEEGGVHLLEALANSEIVLKPIKDLALLALRATRTHIAMGRADGQLDASPHSPQLDG